MVVMQELPGVPRPERLCRALRQMIVASEHWPDEFQFSDATRADVNRWFELELGTTHRRISADHRLPPRHREHYLGDLADALQCVLFDAVRRCDRPTNTQVEAFIRELLEDKPVTYLHSELREMEAHDEPIAETTVDGLAAALRQTISDFLLPRVTALVARWEAEGYWRLNAVLEAEQAERDEVQRKLDREEQAPQRRADLRSDLASDFEPPREIDEQRIRRAPKDGSGRPIPPPPRVVA